MMFILPVWGCSDDKICGKALNRWAEYYGIDIYYPLQPAHPHGNSHLFGQRGLAHLWIQHRFAAEARAIQCISCAIGHQYLSRCDFPRAPSRTLPTPSARLASRRYHRLPRHSGDYFDEYLGQKVNLIRCYGL